jgi:hypothetical protein
MREKPIPREMVFDHDRVFLFECENRFMLITDDAPFTARHLEPAAWDGLRIHPNL